MQEESNVTFNYEPVCNELLQEIYKMEALDFYDFAASHYGTDQNDFENLRSAASHLVKEKLAFYADIQHTSLSISNYGRYWVIRGGYIEFLREGHLSKDPLADKYEMEKHHAKEELLEARLKLTRYRLIGFWVMIFLSLTGFIFSIFNYYMLMKGKK